MHERTCTVHSLGDTEGCELSGKDTGSQIRHAGGLRETQPSVTENQTCDNEQELPQGKTKGRVGAISSKGPEMT